jgi:tetratricopeptide (TPR) repeat protein
MLWHSSNWKRWAPLLPFVTALIWLVHPIHTEVVANIKGRDEILAVLFSFMALGSVVRYFDGKKKRWLAAGLASLCLGMLSKENAFTFILVIPLALLLFRGGHVRRVAIATAWLLLPVIAMLLMRVWALGSLSVSASGVTELMNNPFLEASVAEKYATIFFTLGKYIELLLFPVTLTHDYYPYHIALVSFSHFYVVAAVVGYVSIGAAAVYGIVKRKGLIAFGLAFYLITLSVVSNLFFPVGTFMAERLVFMPSVGIAWMLGWIIVQAGIWVSKPAALPKAGTEFKWMLRNNKPGLLLLLAIVAGYGFKTIDRNPVWQNNQTLFLTDVQTSQNSAKMNNAAGGMLYDMSQADTTAASAAQSYMERARHYLQRAVQIHPRYSAAWQTLGNVYFFLDHDIDKALAAYEQADNESAYNNMIAIGQQAKNKGNLNGAAQCFRRYITQRPGRATGYMQLASLLLDNDQADEAIKVLNEGLQRLPGNADLLNKLGLAHGKGKQNFEQAIEYFQGAIAADSTHAEALENLGVAYGFVGSNQKSLEYFAKALKFNPNDPGLNQNLANAYYKTGDVENGEKYEQRARQLAK